VPPLVISEDEIVQVAHTIGRVLGEL
jgi:hypothetical protein